MKKTIFNIAILFITTSVFAQTVNDFERLLQMKAVETASYGTYILPGSPTPYDYYTVSTLNRIPFTNNGQTASTERFNGVCMDYSVWMYKSITENKAIFERHGMSPNQYFIAVSTKNPNDGITLYKLANRNNSDIRINNYYLKRHRHLSATPHDNNTNHAWIIIQHNNGTLYWVDPTWTDNTGRVVFGTIINNKEVSKKPIENLCVIQNNLPPPSGSYVGYYTDFYIPLFFIGIFSNFGMSNKQDLISLGVDIFGEKNTLGFSFEILYGIGDSIETYNIIDKYSYEKTNYSEYAFYFAAHYSFLKLLYDTILVGGTLGLGYYDAIINGGGSGYSSSGYSHEEFSGSTNDNISSGMAIKIGTYIMYSLDFYSIKGLIEYKSFGGFSLGVGLSILF